MKLALCFVAALSLAPWSSGAHAAVPCATFRQRLAEPPPDYEDQYPLPKYPLKKTGGENHYEIWGLHTFDDVDASVLCRDGNFLDFKATGKSATADIDSPHIMEDSASSHVLLLAMAGIHAFCMDWQVATNTHNSLYQSLRLNPHRIADVESWYWGYKASLLISFGGLLDFDVEDARVR
jgi:hypothetical protein